MKTNDGIHAMLRSPFTMAIIPTTPLLSSALLYSMICVAILIPSTTRAMLRATTRSTGRRLNLAKSYHAHTRRDPNPKRPAKPLRFDVLNSLLKEYVDPINQWKIGAIDNHLKTSFKEAYTDEERLKASCAIKEIIDTLLKEHIVHVPELLSYQEKNQFAHYLLHLILVSQSRYWGKNLQEEFAMKNYACNLLTKKAKDVDYRYQNALGIKKQWPDESPMVKHHRVIELLLELATKWEEGSN